MDAIEFLNKNNILWQPCFINKLKEPDTRDNLWKLNCEPKQTDWKKLPREIIKKRQKLISEVDTIVVDTNNIIHIDIDMLDKNEYDQSNFDFIKQQIKNKPYYKSMSVDKGKKEGKHFFAKTDYKFSTQRPQTKYEDIELLCGQWAYLNKHQKIHIPENMKMEITEDEIKDILPPIPNTKTIKKIESNFSGDIPVSIDEDIEKIDKETLFKIVDNLNVSNFEKIDDWKKFMFAMINQSKGGDSMEYLNKTMDFLKPLKNFDFQENYNFWNKYKESPIVHPAKLFYDWLKRDNKALYDKLILFVNKNFDKDEFKKKKTYKDKKLYFEKYAFKACIEGSPMFCMLDIEQDRFKEYNETGIRTTFKHLKIEIEGKKKHFMDLWTDDEDIRLYDYIEFAPPPSKLYKDTYNLYNGLRAEKDLQDIEVGNIDRILKHIYYLCGENQTNTDYMLDMMASKVKYPGKLPGVGIILKSIQGVGKNLLADFFGNHILGARYYLCDSNADTFLGRFGCGLKNKLLCVMNEVSGKDTFGKDGILKNFITDDKIRYEAKNVNHLHINNFAMIWFFTNNENPLPIEPTDRRLVAFECSAVQRTIPNYFEDLVKDMKDETIQKGFYDYLMNRDIEDDYNFEKNRPVTETYKIMKQNSIPVMIRFFKWYNEEKFKDENIKSKDLWNDYQEFLTETKTKCDMNSNKFGMALQKYKKIIEYTNVNHRGIYTIVWDKFIDTVYQYFE